MAHSRCHLYWQAVHLFTESLNQILVLRLQKAQQRWRRGVNYSLFMHPVPLCMAGVIFPCSRVTLTLQSSVAHSGAQNRIFFIIYTSNIFDFSPVKNTLLGVFCSRMCGSLRALCFIKHLLQTSGKRPCSLGATELAVFVCALILGEDVFLMQCFSCSLSCFGKC